MGARSVTHQIYSNIEKGVPEAFFLRLFTDLDCYNKILIVYISIVHRARMVYFDTLQNQTCFAIEKGEIKIVNF